MGSLRSSAPDHQLGHLDDESLADYLTDVLGTDQQVGQNQGWVSEMASLAPLASVRLSV